MMRAFALVLGLLLLVGRLTGHDAEPTPKKLTKDEIAKAEKDARAHLEKLKGTAGQLTRIEDEATARALPGHAFFAVLFRQFPVARMAPEGLKSANVFAVGRDGKVAVISAPAALEKWFKANLPAPSNETGLKDAARAFLRLDQDLHQDGFFKFRLEDDSTKVTKEKEGRVAYAKAVVMSGGNGTVEVKLTFNAEGKLLKAVETAKLRPGPRPICQATKLLDADPIVKGMAEQALLSMGRAAKPYLDEQRAKATPQLKKAIDRMWRRIVETDTE